MELVKVARKVTTKKDKKEIVVYDLYVQFENGNREKILPNEYTMKDGRKKSNKDVLLSHASDKLPF